MIQRFILSIRSKGMGKQELIYKPRGQRGHGTAVEMNELR